MFYFIIRDNTNSHTLDISVLSNLKTLSKLNTLVLDLR